MEADWEVEIGGDVPVIEKQWPGFADLLSHPDRAFQLQESSQLAGLAEVLIDLNAASSPVRTSKCDVWTLTSEEFDRIELDAGPHSATNACACYLDLLPSTGDVWVTADQAVSAGKEICSSLRSIALTNCRADLIVRSAELAPAEWAHGITAYVTACGGSPESASANLLAGLWALTRAVKGNWTVE